MRTMIILTLVVTAVCLAAVGSSLAEEEKKATEEKQMPAGQKVFMEQKCQMCHTVYAAGIGEPPVEKAEGTEKAEGSEKAEAAEEGEAGPPDLSLAGDSHTAEWLSLFLQKEESLNGKKHMKRFKGSDEDLAALVDWLAAFKTPEKESTETKKPAETEKASEKEAPATPQRSSKPEKSDEPAPASGSGESKENPGSDHAEKGHEGCGH